MPPFLPESFLTLLTAFQDCFHAPSYRNFRLIVAGWVHCLGRRTVTAVALASGAGGSQHISVFHRFFARAEWSLDALGKVIFTLALRWVPAEQPLLVLVDDTLARKRGKCVSLASMHHDPLLALPTRPCTSFGHIWVTLALWVPLPMGHPRGFALPLLVRRYTSSKRGGPADAPSRPSAGRRQQTAATAHARRDQRTKLDLARELVELVAGWAGERTSSVLADSAYAAKPWLEHRPANVQFISRLRMDAALWTQPPARRPGQIGRPRRRGDRLPAPTAMAAARRCWHRLTVTLYGCTVTTQVFRRTALWYAALPDQLVRIVVVRDPGGRRQDDAFFCTDLQRRAAFILEAYARRWTLEVTLHDVKQFLGFEDPQNQTPRAVQRTAPLAFVVYDLVLLWYADQHAQAVAPVWVLRPWFRRKTAPSFLDRLTELRRAGWRCYLSQPPSAVPQPQNSRSGWPDAVLATA
jgi:hypothetical protein